MNLKEKLKEPIFEIVAKAAKKLGVETYVVGGYVRDLLLERPSKDIDFVCVGSGVELAKAVHELLGGNKHFGVFKSFGTAMIKDGDNEYEFVGARKESYSRNSRKPVVEDGTLEDDQNRRDFTINALAVSLNESNYGELVDPFNGVEDLKEKLIRTPLEPERTFSDDPLRMMRAIRFASQLNFDIDGDTFEAIGAMRERIKIVSKERIIVELNKIILSKTPSYGFKLLFHTKLLHEFFPEMAALQGVQTKDDKSHKDNFYHTLQVLDNISEHTDDLWLRWAAIMHDIAKPATKRFNKKVGWTFHGHEDKGARMTPGIFRRLKLPMGPEMKLVQKLVRLHLRPIPLVRDEITDSAIRRLLFDAGDDIDGLMMLCRADITSKNNAKVKRFLRNFDIVEEKMREVEEKDKIRNFQPVITGDMVMKAFDLKPSRDVGDIKEALKEAVLDGQIKNEFEEAYGYMEKIGREKGLKIVNPLK
ncbi:CCA tRNA nucleotidyltransferase [Roseivirga pacifica]|uniref:CCA tRNA nucleotidyltransferase n=1 Tax=Roseivirga pacifica TaxID=1267423 RepID=UPI00209639D7|nr:HD domain-containing protein [Roseivirga pacifica]MCO6357929.1 HD domain-containing protein [Roseivirga pacifica]MCO6366368.1 HD domain-containing protein [Roseivirga pacifica]MCO6370853.1 HD domain-containing protein [Roseivirga pacifica]MCO6373661.1 HD domain-containing protein [Roseivirga pacifica]MCO6380642.1 HD domain-containing protein [Roseivirga pacifica]